ncbi:FAD-binding and (Fe-S)-binding domain-containing protein [Pseudomonas sp. BF-R-19]|uniref:D-2-hydroxyglutarate dehydrogenase YdiJ n=1 Tax=Pseudomonas sp. BF-R-19 TaxID=2832397 RepID=UPI001CC011F3|nr:FAD-binding and (Fe-S)-binding domain-containing protein [Pseudomonas sp. BF-R-19]
MIAQIAAPVELTRIYRTFLDSLHAQGFKGEITPDYANRTVLATDNSIYQRLPQAALFPRDVHDIHLLTRLVAQKEFRQIVITPRGGGTGTNGQSLTHGLIVDLSKHLNQILELNVEERWVRVQAGVVKDQLNAALKPHGLFFAPELSTSNRATIGGMINTDASGQGSCTYGKTRDHVLELKTMLWGGDALDSKPLYGAELQHFSAAPGIVGRVHRCVTDIHKEHRELIDKTFPKLNRCLTGYDLAHIRDERGRVNLNNILCGSEGSLGFVVEAKLNVLPIPKHSTLINVSYASFMEALRDARALMALKPLSIETVDSKVLGLAMQDIVWHDVAEYFPPNQNRPTLGINLIEFSGDDASALEATVNDFLAHLSSDKSVERIGHTLAKGAQAISRVYSMRKRAVGLLGNVKGEIRPQAFVEDTAVPPENLADFITEFRALLDSHNLQYGMFGHVDAGVLHVRPALDMKDPIQASLVRTVSDGVAELTHKYGGLLWGEHGKGVRSEYAPKFFGKLYPVLQQLKAAFDPYNQLNPGKIATPLNSNEQLLKIDEVPMRGEYDRQIDERVWQSYESAVHCNGNGACYNFDPNDAMCPSWKATRERVHSPKGRASLIREWLRIQGNAGIDVLKVAQRAKDENAAISLLRKVKTSFMSRSIKEDFSHQVFDAMSGCLACKSCAGQCPIKVNVPEFRSRFLELYHTRYFRPLKDYLIGSLEFTIPYFARAPWLYNSLMSTKPVSLFLKKYGGMVDSPLLSNINFADVLKKAKVKVATPETLESLTESERKRSVILVQDAFTRYFETQVVSDWIELISKIGYHIYLAPFSPNGKPLQVLGFLGAFENTARKSSAKLYELSKFNIPLVGLDPAMTLVYRQEYSKLSADTPCPMVFLPQEWLAKIFEVGSPVINNRAISQTPYLLLAHCTEKTNTPASTALWQTVFEKFGMKLIVIATGCCGMSGTYGHESRNYETSKEIYGLSWQSAVEKYKAGGKLLANGYSCRSQVKRFGDEKINHPIQALLAQIKS